MRENARELLDEISNMNNIYGFCARHYVRDENAIPFLNEVNKAILENKLSVDESMKKKLEGFTLKALNHVDNINRMEMNDLKNI